MKDWWSGLSLREQALIGAAGALLVLVIFWYGIASPLFNARAEARMARQTAADELAQVERLLAVQRARMPLSSSTTSAGRAPYAGDAFKTEVTRAAQTAGLAISRLQGGEAGRFSLVFEQADIRQLYYWMNEIETRLGGRIERMSIDQASNDRVRATIDVAAGGSQEPMRILLILAALVALVWAGLSQIPLGFALRQVPLNAMGVNWTQSEGTVWNGRIMGVYLNGQPVGDIDVALQPVSLLLARPKVDLQWGGAGGRGAGSVAMHGDILEASDLRMEQNISALESLSPEVRAIGGTLRLSQGAVRIEGRDCTSATGRLSSDTLSIAATRFDREFSELTGSLDCVDGAFSIAMNGSGPSGDTVAVDADVSLYGRSQIEIVANTNDDEIETLLANAGFARQNGVWTYTRETGAMGQGAQ